MWFQNYFTTLTATPTRRRPVRRSHRASRLGIETLEDRRLLAFNPVASYTVGASPQAVATADFNNDGQLDLVTANYGASTVSVLLGNGHGTFQPARTSDAGPYYYSPAFATGDFDNDGNLDLVTNALSVLWGNGDGTFRLNVGVVAFGYDVPMDVKAGDLNADGNTDLVYTQFLYDQYDLLGSSVGSVTVVLGDGQGGFATSSFTYAPYFPNRLAIADLNGDGDPDVVTSNYYNNVSVLLGNGDGTLRYDVLSSNFATGPVPQAVAAGDFTGDGIHDLVTAGGQRVDVLPGLGDGTFAPAIHQSANGTALATVAAADFNGDGKLDVVTSDATAGTVSVFLGLGDGSLAAPIDHAVGSSPSAVAVGDFNGDGKPDLAAANAGSSTVSVLLNDGAWAGQSAPRLRINDVTVTEGNTGTIAAVFTVTLSAVSSQTVTVAYATANSTAATGSDYQAASGTLIFAPGETNKSISVLVKGDRLGEPNETFLVNLTSPTNATIIDGQGVGTIADNEPRISINDVTKQEGNANTTLFSFTVTLSAAYDQAVTVKYATANGTAKAGSDYQSKTGTVTFAPGQTSKTITVAVIGNKQKEANETFFVNLSEAIGGVITDSQGVGTILNDDGGGSKGNRASFALAVDAAIDDWMPSGRKKRNR